MGILPFSGSTDGVSRRIVVPSHSCPWSLLPHMYNWVSAPMGSTKPQTRRSTQGNLLHAGIAQPPAILQVPTGARFINQQEKKTGSRKKKPSESRGNQ